MSLFPVIVRPTSSFPVSAIVLSTMPLCENDENSVAVLCHNDSSSTNVASAYSRWRPKPSCWLKSFSYYKDKDSMWDLGGDDHDSMEQGNIDVLEMATLSLDVPALERMVIDDEMETWGKFSVRNFMLY
ncbi:hypothetical protein ACLB2K_012890 [Fragaria x ananassa]